MSDFECEPLQQNLTVESKSFGAEDTKDELIFHSTEKLFGNKTRQQLRAEMRQGYIEMASVNLAISNEFRAIESELSISADFLL